MSTEEEILLQGFPPHLKAYFRPQIPRIPMEPDILVEIGRNHRDRGNIKHATECWREAMRQTTDPNTQCTAAYDTVEAIALYNFPPVYRQLAEKILHQRANNGNLHALDALSRYVTRPSPHP